MPRLLPALALLLATSPLVAGEHTFRKQQLTDVFYGEGAHFADFDGDGDGDVVSGPYWYEGPDFEKKHEIYPPKPYKPKGYSDNFLVFTYDFDGDGDADVLVNGFPGKESWWFENPGKNVREAGHWTRHVAFEVTDNETPVFGDITGDGKPELVFQTADRYGYATPNWEKPTEKWTFHAVSGKGAGGRFNHGIGLGDVDGDGRSDFLTKTGWYQQPTSLEGDPLWQFHAFPIAPDPSNIYAYDFDGDGDNDILTAHHCHAYGLNLHVNQGKTDDGSVKFETMVVMGEKPEDSPHGVCFTQAHAIDLVDVNGDGVLDFVTGKRWWAHNGRDPGGNDAAVLYWFETKQTKDGGVDFVPHQIDDDSGVGTQVTAGDLNGDGHPEVIVGNKKGTFVFHHEVK